MKCLANSYITGVLICLLWHLVASPAVFSEETVAEHKSGERPFSASIIISRNIRPYVDAADAMREVLGKKSASDIAVYELYRFSETTHEELGGQLSEHIYDPRQSLFIAVGPEATAFLWQRVNPLAGRKFYSLVLNPEKISAPVALDCGISLNIPPRVQLTHIRKSLPEAERIGIFFDPTFNDRFYEKAEQAASELGLVLVPLSVSSKKEIPAILSGEIPKLDAIWLIPDRTVISESIAQYIIKQSVLQEVPVIGYNQFFYDSGAAVAFVFDYSVLGRQTVRAALAAIRSDQCRKQVPAFKVWINQSVFEKLDMALPEMHQPMVLGP
jgi:putative ABC transport system substrate-binding protein